MAEKVTPAPGSRFLALEGPDGSGKSTQAARLVDWMRPLVPEVVACRDPGGTALGERVRSILMDRSDVAIGLRCEMLLFMASRAQMVDEVIRPALNRGASVVSDRFLLSNIVYQGFAGGLDVDEVWRVGRASTGGLYPDLTILIDVTPEVASARVGAPRDRMEDRSEDYRRRVRDGYLEAVRTAPSPCVVIDGSLGPDEVAGRIRTEVSRVLGIGPRS